MKKVLLTGKHDSLNRLDHWQPRLEDIGVPTADTECIDMLTRTDEPPKLDESLVIDKMREKGWHQAHIRSMYKSAQLSPLEGSMIQRPSPSIVLETISSLVSNHMMMDKPTGGRVAIREWLDINYCAEYSHAHEHEVRCFLRDGEPAYSFPSVEHIKEKALECDAVYSEVKEEFQEVDKPPIEYIQTAANEFDQYWWHLDFVLTTEGEWYAVDMGLDGLYWNEDRNEWWSISEHNDKFFGPESQLDRLPVCTTDYDTRIPQVYHLTKQPSSQEPICSPEESGNKQPSRLGELDSRMRPCTNCLRHINVKREWAELCPE